MNAEHKMLSSATIKSNKNVLCPCSPSILRHLNLEAVRAPAQVRLCDSDLTVMAAFLMRDSDRNVRFFDSVAAISSAFLESHSPASSSREAVATRGMRAAHQEWRAANLREGEPEVRSTPAVPPVVEDEAGRIIHLDIGLV